MADDGWGWLRKEAGLMGDTVSDRTMEQVRAYAGSQAAAQNQATPRQQGVAIGRGLSANWTPSPEDVAKREAEETERQAFALRHTALEMAVRVMSPSRDPNAVLSAARSFMAFLKDEKEAPRYPGSTKDDPLGQRVHGVAAVGFDQKNW